MDDPPNAGIFCCDQVVYYEPSRDCMFWLLQYVDDGNTNIQRLAVANSASDVASNTWYWYDVSPADFGFPATGYWLDFPDLSVSDNYMYLTTNIFQIGSNSTSTAGILRMPLDELSLGQGVTADYLVTGRPSLRCTHGTGSTMYWGAHNSNTSIRIYRWAEGSSSISWDDVSHSPYNVGCSACPVVMTATGPDGNNFAGWADNRILGAFRADGVLGFMWNAAQGGTYPYPHTWVVRFRESDRSLISQEQIWNPNYAWLYPSVHPNTRGDLGGTIAVGGGSVHPQTNAFIVDGFNGRSFAPLENIVVTIGLSGPASNRWGDYLTCRMHRPSVQEWAATAYGLIGPNHGDANPVYVWFGRDGTPPTESVSDPSTPTGSTAPCPGDTATYQTGGATSSFGDPVEYQFDWGDGNSTGWGASSRSHTWSAGGPFCVQARARCTIHTGVVSNWSPCLSVTVQDISPPTINCPGNIVAFADPGTCTLPVTFPSPSAGDDCDASPTVVCNPASGSIFPLGTTQVTCTATDASGNSAQCTFNVTVQDVTAPSITCPLDVTVDCTSPSGASVTFPTLSVSDNCDASPTVVCNPASGSIFPLGTTQVTCTATDASGNSAQCTFNVMVQDAVPRLWISDQDGDWFDPANWSCAQVPDSNDDVVIDRGPANPTVTVSGGTANFKSLVNRETIQFEGAISTGDVFSASDGRIYFSNSTGEFNVVTLAGNSWLEVCDSTVTLSNALDVPEPAAVSLGGSTLNANLTIATGGVLYLFDFADCLLQTYPAPPSTVTGDILVENGGTLSCQLTTLSAASITNHGLITGCNGTLDSAMMNAADGLIGEWYGCRSLTLTGASFANAGQINVPSGGFIQIDAPILSQTGNISVAGQTGLPPSGPTGLILNQPMTNEGSLELITGGTIDGTALLTNGVAGAPGAAVIEGDGTIKVDLMNDALVAAGRGDQLAMQGPATVINNGTFDLAPLSLMTIDTPAFAQTGLVMLAPSSVCSVINPLDNAGSMVVSGGLLDAAAITKAGDLQVYGGQIAAADLTCETMTGMLYGYGDIYSNVTNDNDVTVIADTQVVGDYTNNGTTTVQSGILTVTGSLNDNGMIIGDTSGVAVSVTEGGLATLSSTSTGLTVIGDYNAGIAASLVMPSNGLTVKVGGNFNAAINDNTRFDMAQATLQTVGLGTAPQDVEVMSKDIGCDSAGLDRAQPGHFPLGTLRIGPTPTTVNLVDNHDNDGQGQTTSEAVYVDTLIIDSGARLNTSGRKVYYNSLSGSGAVDNPANLIQLGACVAQPIPAISTRGAMVLSLLLVTASALAIRRRRSARKATC